MTHVYVLNHPKCRHSNKSRVNHGTVTRQYSSGVDVPMNGHLSRAARDPLVFRQLDEVTDTVAIR